MALEDTTLFANAVVIAKCFLAAAGLTLGMLVLGALGHGPHDPQDP